MIEGAGRLERRGLARGLKISLDVLFYLTLVIVALLVVSTLISTFTDYDDGWDLVVPATLGEKSFFPRSVRVEFEAHPPPEIEVVRLHGRQELHLFHHQLSLTLVSAAVDLVALGLILWALVLLRRILATTAGGRPFDADNPRRLSVLGWIILCAALSSSLLHYVESSWALSRVEVTSLPLSPVVELHEGWLVCGLLTLLLAAIWKQAVAMAEDQALTV